MQAPTRVTFGSVHLGDSAGDILSGFRLDPFALLASTISRTAGESCQPSRVDHPRSSLLHSEMRCDQRPSQSRPPTPHDRRVVPTFAGKPLAAFTLPPRQAAFTALGFGPAFTASGFDPTSSSGPAFTALGFGLTSDSDPAFTASGSGPAFTALGFRPRTGLQAQHLLLLGFDTLHLLLSGSSEIQNRLGFKFIQAVVPTQMWTLVGARMRVFWIARLGSVHLPVGTRDGHE
ncbi:hypothetical protein CRG98_030755 [Punica granatum]|uniref:Uncharacterized protein n=1 Tax=Punica granatum TaxID=22663 RepID=A0A2I0IXX0_PUNGR|nr:hypothetical protein CRG98_030755 [Punica granatum]